MNKTIKASVGSLIITVLSWSVQAKEVTLTSSQSFELSTDYFASNTKSERAVLMLHQCNYNRTMYDTIGEQLAKRGIHALSLDFRGFGESTNNEFNIAKLQELPQEQRRKAWGVMSADWPKDVKLAYDFLKKKAGSDQSIGVIGASCGGSQAITLAENNPVKAINFFSSGQREANIERYKNTLANKPTLIIAAEDDGNTYTSAKILFNTANHKQSQFISYKGNDHGYPLLAKDQHLAGKIVNWFDDQL